MRALSGFSSVVDGLTAHRVTVFPEEHMPWLLQCCAHACPMLQLVPSSHIIQYTGLNSSCLLLDELQFCRKISRLHAGTSTRARACCRDRRPGPAVAAASAAAPAYRSGAAADAARHLRPHHGAADLCARPSARNLHANPSTRDLCANPSCACGTYVAESLLI
jgi:hypothetical protein